MCDNRICLNDDYFYNLSTAQRLYYKYIRKRLDIPIDQIEQEIINGLKKADKIKNNYVLGKLKLSWCEYKKIVNQYLKRIFDNYIPIEEFGNLETM